MLLKGLEGQKASDGAHFEVVFDKARHFHGEDAYAFIAQLKVANDAYVWETSDTQEEVEITELVRLRKEGATIEYLTQKTKLTKGQIEWRLKKAKEMGLL